MAGFLPKANNFMRRIVWHGCARPWYVFAETFVPAFIDLAITVAILDLDDIIRNRGEQLAGEGSRRTRRGMGHVVKPKAGVKDVPRERYAALGLKTVLKITAPLEPIGFAFLLYEAGDEFFYKWQTLIEQAPFCTEPIESGPFSRSEPAGRALLNPGGQAQNLDVLEQNRAGWANNPFSVAVPGGYYQVFFVATVAGPSGGHPGCTARIQISGPAIPNQFNSETIELEEDVFVSLVVQGEFFVSTLGVASISWELVGAQVPVGIPLEQESVFVMRVG